MKDIRVIQIGLGAMGKTWLKEMAASPGVKVIAWVDSNRQMLDPLIQAGAPKADHFYFSLEDALLKEEADAVVIATPPETHADTCIAASRAGLHVLCEKPLSDSFASAQRSVEEAERAGKILMVGQNRRHAPFIHAMRDLIRSNKYGKPGQAFVSFRQNFTRDSFRDVMEHPLLMDMSIHHFDAIRCVMGSNPIRVRGMGWNPSWSRFKGISSAEVVFTFPDNFHLVYSATWHAINVEMTSNGCDWRIECSNGVIQCKKEVVYAGYADPSPTGSLGPTGSYGVTALPVEMPQRPKWGGGYLLDQFLHCIREGLIPETSGKDNLNTLAMVFSSIKAVDSGESIDIA
jgi:predicted dehydrogenase